MNLQRERETLYEIIDQMKASSNPNIDRESFIDFAEQLLGTIDAVLTALDDHSRRIPQD